MVNHTENYHEASLVTEDGDLVRDVVLAFQVTRPMTGMDLLASKNKGEDGYFVLTLTAGAFLRRRKKKLNDHWRGFSLDLNFLTCLS